MKNLSKLQLLRRSLVTSVISLVTCCTTFVGTAFAWFTDSASSNNNLIVSGNLDVELKYLNANNEWQEMTEDTNVFMENALWEPGHTEVVYLKIENAGTLAFNYKLGVDILEEQGSINVNDEEFKLSDYIVMGSIDGVETAYETRAEVFADLDQSTVAPLAQTFLKDGALYPANNIPTDIEGATNVAYLALVVYMPGTVENEVNYKRGEAVPYVKLGINLLATQKTYEKDAFDDQYDADANTSTPPVPSYKDTIAVTVYDVFDANKPQTNVEVEVDVYSFIATDYDDALPLEEYGDWTADFFVSTDSPVAEGFMLFGNYGDFGWLGFWVPESDVAYEPVGLLGVVSSGGESNWTYEEIYNDVGIFRCGLYDYEGNNAGMKVTVDLRIKSPDKTQEIVVRSITVTIV